MFKIAYKLVLSRKWWLTLIVGSIALILAGTMSIFYATETIKSNLKEKAYQQFGEHTGLIFDVNTSKNELIGRVDALVEMNQTFTQSKKKELVWLQQQKSLLVDIIRMKF